MPDYSAVIKNPPEFPMNKTLQLTSLTLAFLVLVACDRPATDAAQTVETEQTALAQDQNNDGQMVSIDADGNIAPFGFASKQPVAIAEPEMVATEQAAVAASAIYSVHCIACHGADATGVQGLGLNLVESELVVSSTEAEMLAFLKEGRLPDSPDSVTGMPMPAFAWMSDSDLAEVTGYLQSL